MSNNTLIEQKLKEATRKVMHWSKPDFNCIVVMNITTFEVKVVSRDLYYFEENFEDKYVILKGQDKFMTECICVYEIPEVPGFIFDSFLTNFKNYDYVRKLQSVYHAPGKTVRSLDKAWIAYAVTVLCNKFYVPVPEWTKDIELYQTVPDNPLKRRKEDCDERALKYNIYGKEVDVIRS